MMDYQQRLAAFQAYYDQDVSHRDGIVKSAWKQTERQRFLDMLKRYDKHSLLEVGAGTGQDSLFFQQQGLEVTATDLSAAMVEACIAKGLPAYQCDFLSLQGQENIDAIYALNCLLHVPKVDLTAVLQRFKELLKPRGLFYMGVYGGSDEELIRQEDSYEPKRFFSYYRDQALLTLVQEYFELLYFHSVELEGGWSFHFQSLIMRRSS
jgi:SAM-dependent methyltransferase